MMTTLTVRSQVEPDGTLRLEVPSGLPAGPVEVVVVVNPAPPDPDEARGKLPRPARSGLFLDRGLVGVDVDRVTAEADSAWKASVEAPPT